MTAIKNLNLTAVGVEKASIVLGIDYKLAAFWFYHKISDSLILYRRKA
jgi:hypothetical protein